MLGVKVAVVGVFVLSLWKTPRNLSRKVQLHGAVAYETFSERARVTDSGGSYPIRKNLRG